MFRYRIATVELHSDPFYLSGRSYIRSQLQAEPRPDCAQTQPSTLESIWVSTMAGFPAVQHWLKQSWGIRTAGLTVLAFFQTLLNFLQFNHRKAKDSPYLHDNYTPIREEAFSQNLKVEGTLPAACNGVFMRVGPNPKYEPSGDYHW